MSQLLISTRDRRPNRLPPGTDWAAPLTPLYGARYDLIVVDCIGDWDQDQRNRAWLDYVKCRLSPLGILVTYHDR